MKRVAKAITTIVGVLTVSGAIIGVTAVGNMAVAQTSDPTAVTSSSEADADTELHAVGIYEGYIKSAGQIHGSRANIVVDRPGKQVILSLSAYEPTTWLVEVKPGTTVIRVILGGYDRQVVKGLASDTTIIDVYGHESGRVVVPYAYDQDSVEFRKFVKALSQVSGIAISSFHGAYKARAGMPFIIDVVDRSETKARLSPDYPQLTPAAELPDISYSAILRRDGKALYGKFSQAGPVMESMLPAPSGAVHLAFDPERKRFYMISGEVVEVDSETGATKPLDMGMDVPDLSWPCGITYDTARQRVLVASLGGEGFLYAYDSATRQWSVVTSMYDIDLAALTYDPMADVLYGLVAGGGKARIKKFTADGQFVEDIPLSDTVMPGMVGRWPGNVGVQLVAAGNYLILIADEIDDDRKVTTRTFIIEASTGKALLARVD